MDTCKAQTKRGKPCLAPAGEDGLCSFHSPRHGRELAAGRKLGGSRQRTPTVSDPAKLPVKVRSVDDVLMVLDAVLADSMVLENSAARSRVLIALCAAYLSAFSAGEIEQRLQVVEQAWAAIQKENNCERKN